MGDAVGINLNETGYYKTREEALAYLVGARLRGLLHTNHLPIDGLVNWVEEFVTDDNLVFLAHLTLFGPQPQPGAFPIGRPQLIFKPQLQVVNGPQA